MNRLAKLCGRLIGGHRGFSIGIDDVMPSEVLLDLKARAYMGLSVCVYVCRETDVNERDVCVHPYPPPTYPPKPTNS